MKRLSVAIILCVVMLAMAPPASAFTADGLTIAVGTNGDTEVVFDYSLSWLEHIAVFLQMARPEDELLSALQSSTGKPVSVSSVTSGSAAFAVEKFSRVTRTNDTTTYRVPSIDFTSAEEALKGYWFAPLLSADFSPAITTVRFPDGYEEKFYNVCSIPSVTHTAGA